MCVRGVSAGYTVTKQAKRDYYLYSMLFPALFLALELEVMPLGDRARRPTPSLTPWANFITKRAISRKNRKTKKRHISILFEIVVDIQ